MKRAFDFLFSASVLLVFSPLLVVVAFLVYRQDRHSPIYWASRVGRWGKAFKMAKLRSMIIGADSTGVSSTSASDNRITPLGHFIRRYKLDELSQFYNVLIGEMSVVGPRPQVAFDVEKYTAEERALLNLRPGITDFASIVFADEGDILKESADPDEDYVLVIRPWKMKLCLAYLRLMSPLNDLKIIGLTALSILSRKDALIRLSLLLRASGEFELAEFVLDRADNPEALWVRSENRARVAN